MEHLWKAVEVKTALDNAGFTVWMGSICLIFTHEEFREALKRGKGKKRFATRRHREAQRQATEQAKKLDWIEE